MVSLFLDMLHLSASAISRCKIPDAKTQCGALERGLGLRSLMFQLIVLLSKLKCYSYKCVVYRCTRESCLVGLRP